MCDPALLNRLSKQLNAHCFPFLFVSKLKCVAYETDTHFVFSVLPLMDLSDGNSQEFPGY